MSKIKLTGDTSGYVEISAPNVAANNTLELGGGTKILTNLDNVFTGVTTYSGNIDLNANLDLDDNNKILLGTGDDLQIYHSGTHSYIQDAGTGNLVIQSNRFEVQNAAGSAEMARFQDNGAVSLSYNGSTKFETTTTGATVTGTLVSDSVTSELDLTGISSSISDTAVDIFVYDTRKDSDGGAWRKRTQNTSWYNETLNTSTRGSRREFPAVAVIVAESSTVTIYDGDDPDLPMWMVFNVANNTWLKLYTSGSQCSCITALNATLCAGGNGNGIRLAVVDFIKDNQYLTESGYTYYQTNGIVTRNDATTHTDDGGSKSIVNNVVNDVAMTVLPNAPIDDATGLPVPTIAVATNGGVSVIKDDGNVYDVNDSSGTRNTFEVLFRGDTLTWNNTSNGTIQNKWNIGNISADSYGDSGGIWRYNYNVSGGDSTVENISAILYGSNRLTAADSSDPKKLFIGSNGTSSGGDTEGLTFILDGVDKNTDYSGHTITDSMVAYATTSYNTGWMHGDIKGAFLSDTDTTNATDSNVVTNGTFDSNTNGWSGDSGASISWDSGGFASVNYGGGANDNTYAIQQTGILVSGAKYRITGRVQPSMTGSYEFRVRAGGSSTQWNITSGLTNGQWYSFDTGTITADGTKLEIGSHGGTITNFYLDDVYVWKLEEEDRSVNNTGLEVHGTITKSAVATGADLVAYSGWSNGSGGNYLKNKSSTYNFGSSTTSALCIIGWFKHTSVSQYQYIGSVHNSSVSAGAVGLALNVSNGYPYVYDGNSTTTSSTAYNDGKWHCAVGIIAGGSRKIYVDGNDILTDYRTFYPDISSVDSLAVGHYCDEPNIQYSFLGSLSLVRFSNTIPSPEQIKKIYEDEKFLFQENAKATLYGSSDAVTALGYDEDTELLHVGTSAGRSDFQGLRRINNTTTAVTTAISASDDLIAEQ